MTGSAGGGLLASTGYHNTASAALVKLPPRSETLWFNWKVGLSTMTRDAILIDLTQLQMPELARLAQEVRRTQLPIVLRENGEDVAVLSPAKPARRRKGKTVTDADSEAALAASWVGLVDPETLKRELDAARSDDRPPVEL